MIATVDIADLGLRRTLESLRHRPEPGTVPGLRWLDTAAAVPLASRLPPTFQRAVMIAFWDDESAAVAFMHDHQLGRRFAESGLRAVLRPLRAFGAWPGLPDDVPRARKVDHDSPVFVTTLGKLRMSQGLRFIRASRPAERAALAADGFVWGTTATRPAGIGPPFMVTLSMWETADAAAGYAYSDPSGRHPRAVIKQREKDFHHESAFIRHVPLAITGSLAGMPC
jgi:hypothetical protein